MSKRKAGVNDIIYELDNDDIEISSEDEAKEVKKQRSDSSETTSPPRQDAVSEEHSQEVINLDFSAESADACVIVPTTNIQNGGKTTSDGIVINTSEPLIPKAKSVKPTSNIDNNKKVNSDCSNTTILNEDIVVDSPASNTDCEVVGCENRTPLVTIRFKDKKLARNYKQKVKMFMLSLMQLHDEDNLTGSETETDLEIDVWPEDLVDDIEEPKEEADNLFFVDTAPGGMEYMEEVPTYRQNTTMISNVPVKEATPPPVFRRGPTCFNCDGAHALRDCRLPRNNMRINEKRKNMVKTGRYHVEDDQKYGHLVPGRISGQLRHALGLKRHELPLHIYRMRMLGYPPGWLEEARISHSGITMFDSSGQAILDPEEEEGEVCEPGSKDKFDIKKILDFPGFNVPPSSRYKDEAHIYGLMPMSEQDSKLAMLQMLAPNAMKAYKRKKLTMFPSASNNNSLQGQAEMDLDSGEEVADFPSVPPLPDEAPPPPPPPPPPLPDDPEPPLQDPEQASSDLEVIEVIKVNDIPVPEDEVITIDEINDGASQSDSGRESPTLDDLEEKKKKLLNALLNDVISLSDTEPELEKPSEDTENDNMNNDVESTDEKQDASEGDATNNNNKEDSSTESQRDSKATENATINSTDDPKPSTSITNGPKTPTEKTGHVKSSDFGTPVMNIASSYTKLPTDEMFAKDICDVINFENLPNSTGKYKKISSLLKKVKSEVDRIQDS